MHSTLIKPGVAYVSKLKERARRVQRIENGMVFYRSESIFSYGLLSLPLEIFADWAYQTAKLRREN